VARGPTVFVAGQIGWTPEGSFAATDFAEIETTAVLSDVEGAS
jgi:enamine deaminase RidA (YjgF/YER057c/UK114 family)